jgi:hypothetical protein
MIVDISSKGLDKKDLERLLQLHLQFVSALMFLLIYAWTISFKFVYDCIYFSFIHEFSLN